MKRRSPSVIEGGDLVEAEAEAGGTHSYVVLRRGLRGTHLERPQEKKSTLQGCLPRLHTIMNGGEAVATSAWSAAFLSCSVQRGQLNEKWMSPVQGAEWLSRCVYRAC